MAVKYITGWQDAHKTGSITINGQTIPLLNWSITKGLRKFTGSATLPATYTGFESYLNASISLPVYSGDVKITQITRNVNTVSVSFMHPLDYQLQYDTSFKYAPTSTSDLWELVAYETGFDVAVSSNVAIDDNLKAVMIGYLSYHNISNSKGIFDYVASMTGTTWRIDYDNNRIEFFKYSNPPIITELDTSITGDDAYIRSLTSKPPEYIGSVIAFHKSHTGKIYEISGIGGGDATTTIELPFPIDAISETTLIDNIKSWVDMMNTQYYAKRLTYLGLDAVNVLHKVIKDNLNGEYLYIYEIQARVDNATISTVVSAVKTGNIEGGS
jgi:hypothetical protein